jgi:predicted permease
MQALLQDLRYALRQLLRSPGFTLTAILSLALGVGATAAVFSVIYAVLMDPFPYPHSDQIVRLTGRTSDGAGHYFNLNGPQIQQLRKSPVIAGLLVIDGWALILTGHNLPENVEASFLSSNSFQDLGVPPLLGRGLQPSDAFDGQEPQPVVVLSYKFWQRHFNGNRSVVGQTLELSHKTYNIVGVAPPRFTWYSGDVYLPLKLTQDPGPLFTVNLRLRQNITRQAADAALQPLLEQFAHDTPKRFPQHFRVEVIGLNDWVVKSLGGTLYLLFGAVALLLVIGCGNVSILLLARGAARQHELAVRSAIGASRGRIIRQLVTESLLLAVSGAAFGVLLAFGIVKAIVALLPRYSFAPEVAIQINLPVLFFSISVALLTGLLFGLWPALQLSRPQIGQMIQSGVRKVAGSVRSRRTHSALIAGQIALTLMLLAAAGSAIQAFVRLIHAPLGYDPHNVLPVWIPLPDNRYTTWAERAEYSLHLQSKLAEIPGVLQASISTNATPPQNGTNMRYEILGKSTLEQPSARVNLVSPAYFSTLRILLAEGRLWTEAENRGGARVAIVNQTMARLIFPNGGALGHSIRLPDIESRPPIVLTSPALAVSGWIEIVGIVADARDDGLRNPVKPAIYVPNTLILSQYTQILLRTQVAPTTLVNAVRTQLSKVNPDQQTGTELEDLDQWLTEEPDWAQEHLVAWIFASFAVLALALAAVGLYSVVSYSVVQRTNEFGIRMALGAQRGHVLRIVFSSTALSIGGGIVAGLILTLALNKLLANWSADATNNPLILLAVTLLLSLVGAVACAVPARRAASVDPMTALRCD